MRSTSNNRAGNWTQEIPFSIVLARTPTSLCRLRLGRLCRASRKLRWTSWRFLGISIATIMLPALLVTARAGETLGPPPWTKDHADGGDQRPPPWMPADPGGNKFGVDPMQLLQSKDIKEQLKLTDDQSQQLASLADRYQQEIKKELGNVDLSALSDEERTKKETELRQTLTKLMESERREVEKILNADQLDAFKRIMLKVNGAEA
jgi:Spy/CpxP family protein refolding chaperone